MFELHSGLSFKACSSYKGKGLLLNNKSSPFQGAYTSIAVLMLYFVIIVTKQQFKKYSAREAYFPLFLLAASAASFSSPLACSNSSLAFWAWPSMSNSFAF
jgi:hypothetical protein